MLRRIKTKIKQSSGQPCRSLRSLPGNLNLQMTTHDSKVQMDYTLESCVVYCEHLQYNAIEIKTCYIYICKIKGLALMQSFIIPYKTAKEFAIK